MRVLFLTPPEAWGHFWPMEALARTAEARGHQVAFATGALFKSDVEAAGFRCFGIPWFGPILAKRKAGQRGPGPMLEPALRIFGTLAARLADDLAAVIGAWSPDVVVHDRQGLAAPLAAEMAGIPTAHVSLGVMAPSEWIDAVAVGAAPVWRDHGFEPLPMAGMYRYLYLDYCPPALQLTDIRDVPVAWPVRYPLLVPSDPVTNPAGRPVIYVSFGTSPSHGEESLGTVIEALGQEHLDVVITGGPLLNEATVHPVPSNVVLERFIPQHLVLPRCSAVLCHGGSGTMLGAVAQGLPMVLWPIAADQFINTDQCLAAGVAVALGVDPSPDDVRLAVREVTHTPAYRTAAQTVGSQIEAMPTPQRAVDLLEELAERREPLTPQPSERS